LPGTILYATSLLPAQDSSERVSRQLQSAAAQGLLDFLQTGVSTGAGSKSHSRAAVAAALGDTEIPALGIDIEFMAEDRPITEMARYLWKCAPANIGLEEFYRRWTFAEAYFKAFQHLPPDWAVHSVGNEADARGTRRLRDGTHLSHSLIADRFQLCLVWRSSAERCELRYISVRE